MTILLAGKYWIGDPCYVLGHDHPELNFKWDEFCDYCFEDDSPGRSNEGIIDHQGIIFAHYGTACGDGQYYDQYGNGYGVDAGMIGCIPYDKISSIGDAELNRLGHIHTFSYDFETSYHNGTIGFGKIIIPTGDSNEYEDEE